MHMRNEFRKNGFTLIEMVIVVSLIVAMLGISAMSFNALGRSMALENASNKVQQMIYLARQLTLNRKIQYRVVFFRDRVVLWGEDGGFLDKDQRPIDVVKYKEMNPTLAAEEFVKYGMPYGRQVECMIGYKPGKPDYAPEWNVENAGKTAKHLQQHSIGFNKNGEVDFFGFTSVPKSALNLDSADKAPTGGDLIFTQMRTQNRSYVDIDPAGGKLHHRIFADRGIADEQ